MSVSGIVARLSGSPDTIREGLAALASRSAWTVGTSDVPGRVPLVLEARGARASRDEIRWLESLPCVELVELVYVDFAEGSGDVPAATRAESRARDSKT